MDRVQRRDDNAFVWADLHGGQGAVQVRRYFERALPWPIELEVWEIPVGGSEGVHRHGIDDPDGYLMAREFYLVLDGAGRFTIGGEQVDVGPGDAVQVDPLTERGVRNTGDRPLRLLVLADLPSPGA